MIIIHKILGIKFNKNNATLNELEIILWPDLFWLPFQNQKLRPWYINITDGIQANLYAHEILRTKPTAAIPYIHPNNESATAIPCSYYLN